MPCLRDPATSASTLVFRINIYFGINVPVYVGGEVHMVRDANSPLIFIPRVFGEWQFAIPRVPWGISGNVMFYPALERPNTVLEHPLLF